MSITHLLGRDKLALLGCRDSFLHGCKKTGFFIEIKGNNIRHQAFRDGSGISGDLREFRPPDLIPRFRGVEEFKTIHFEVKSANGHRKVLALLSPS
ncbi:MAG: hypothetical protein M3Y27_09695 [Acidobacteriota bacterium]|nr:hypothetical protein [Acidobacteriota bacterium]